MDNAGSLASHRPYWRRRAVVKMLWVVVGEAVLTGLLVALAVWGPVSKSTASTVWGGTMVAFVGAIYGELRPSRGRKRLP